MAYRVVKVARLKPSERRAIAFLVDASDGALDAAATFDSLDPKRKREVNDRFDLWIEGEQRRNNYFHGFPSHPKYKHCFVFKWKENRKNHRLYGFIVNPRPKSRPRFEVCVLVSHATKGQWETDPTELANSERLRLNDDVVKAIKNAFPEMKP